MPALNFKPAFAPQVASGEKPLSLRRLRKPPSKHVQVGEPLALWTGMRTKEARRLGVGLCVVRGLMRFSAAGIILLSELRVHDLGGDPFADRITRPALDRESDAFARLDGFENWASAWAWHDSERQEHERGAANIVRELIAWKLLTDEQVAAFETGRAPLPEVA